jgi:hypothetical protein
VDSYADGVGRLIRSQIVDLGYPQNDADTAPRGGLALGHPAGHHRRHLMRKLRGEDEIGSQLHRGRAARDESQGNCQAKQARSPAGRPGENSCTQGNGAESNRSGFDRQNEVNQNADAEAACP